MKTTLVIAIALFACTEGARAPVTAQEAGKLPFPVAGASAREYHATNATLRLFGIEQHEAGNVAVIADEATWNTRSFREGDALERNLTVSEIGGDRVVLSGPNQRLVLRPGERASARLVRHASDTLVERDGDLLIVDAAALRDIRERNPGAVDARPFRSAMGVPGVGIRDVAAHSALAQLGVRPGDAILAVDGSPATAELLASVVERLTVAGAELQLRIFRNGEVFESHYRARLE